MPREEVSVSQISDQLGNSNGKTHQIRFRKKRGEYKVKRLYSNLFVPSCTHGYSLAIEFMRSWFLKKFPKDYFKTVYINGKHVLDDYKYFNRNIVKRDKPMVAIVPNIDYEFDREYVDMYVADPKIFLKRSNYQQSFFRDDERSRYLGMNMRALKMNFAFKIRVSTRAQQLDLFRAMELAFRIGATQEEYLSADFLIPKDIIISIAKASGFKVTEDGRIVDVLEFLSYFNSHSDLPIMFKLRAINQKPEFFIRVKDLYTHLSLTDRLTLDDGEREGQLDTNFHIEMGVQLTIPVPHFFVYYDCEALTGSITVEEDLTPVKVGLYSFTDFEIPEKNELGWGQIALHSYLCDKGEKFVDMSEVFSGSTNLDIVMKDSLKRFISPKSFIDIQVFRHDDRAMKVKTEMDYETRKLMILEEVDEEAVTIAIYADRQHINETIISLNEYGKSRITQSE